MTALAVPAYQSKSNRNLFSDASSNMVFSTDLAGIEMEPVHGISPKKDSLSLKMKSPSKSPSKSPKTRSPSKSPKSRGPEGENFFSPEFKDLVQSML